jgi:lipopolysaccharide export system permease protein
MYDAPMPAILYRYLTREIISPFFLGITTFTAVLLMGRMLKLADMVVSKGVPLHEVLLMIVYLLPYFAMITIPMSLLLAVLLAFSRMSADGEITALKAGGTSLYGLLPPVLAVAFLAYLATTGISLYALPKGNVAFKQLLYQVMENRLSVNLKERVFNDLIPGLVIYINRHEPESRDLTGILIHDGRDPKSPATIFAKTGRISYNKDARQIRLQLDEGSIHQPQPKGDYRRLDFQQYDLSINLNTAIKSLEKNELDMTLAELRANLRQGGFSPRLTTDMGMEVYRRFALPFACFIFVLVGMPLGIQNQRSGKGAGFSLSIGVILVYYLFQSAARALGEKSVIHPGLAIWLPNLIFLVGGVYLFRMIAAERPVPLLGSMPALLGALRNKLANRRRS